MKAKKIRKQYPYLFDYTMNAYSGNDYIDRLWHQEPSILVSAKKKCINVILYILQKAGEIDHDKLINLMYLANRYHLRNYARPIWEDVWFAKKEGPRPFYAELVIKELADKRHIKLIKKESEK
jgi:hypothetical protein